MKDFMRIIGLWMVAVCSIPMKAQIVRWLIPANYDKIQIMYNGMYRVEKDGKKGIFNQNGKEILPTEYDYISQFKDGYALLFDTDENGLVGYVDEKGTVTDLKKKGYHVTSGYPYFSNGQLLVMKGNYYYFIKATTGEEKGPFAEARPFFDGYASVSKFENPDKLTEDTYPTLITAENCEEYSFPNQIDKSDINYLSSASNGKVLVFMKRKAYELDCDSNTVRSLYSDLVKNKNTMITATNKHIVITKDEIGDGVLQTKNARLYFDRYERLSKMVFRNDSLVFNLVNIKAPEYQSHVAPFHDIESGTYGLQYDGITILPPQFQAVGLTKEKEAIVTKDGKIGVLVVEPNQKMTFRINDNNNIGFIHDKYLSTLITTMPAYIDCKTISVECLTNGCQLLSGTRKDISNPEVSSVSYNCEFSISTDISETVKTFPYKFKVKYDGLESVDYVVNVGAWYVKNISVDMENLTQIQDLRDSTITVHFNIKVNDSEKTYYSKEVKVYTDNIECPLREPLKKITETEFEARIKGTTKNNVTCFIQIQEGNCPIILQPFILKKLEAKKPETPKSKPKPKPQPKPKPKPQPKTIDF